MSDLNETLHQFEATEANLTKLERVWDFLQKYKEITGEERSLYENKCSSYLKLLEGLPLIDAWKPQIPPFNFSKVEELMDKARKFQKDFNISSETKIYKQIEKPGEELRKYRFFLDQKRRQLIRKKMFQILKEIDVLLDSMQKIFPIDDEDDPNYYKKIDTKEWDNLNKLVQEIDRLLGSSIPRPSRLEDMQRHLYYGQVQDLRDIIYLDWPSVKSGLTESLYASNEPIPVTVNDLSDLVASAPSGPVITKLNWERLSSEDFERLIFNLLAAEPCYQNPQWLTHTNATDRGRDLSAVKTYEDALSGSTSKQVIIQCKHWQSKKISVTEITTLKEQMKLWTSPRIDILVIATTSRFTTDAIQYVENYNQQDRAMRIEMWAGSNLERILAKNPALVAEFNLR